MLIVLSILAIHAIAGACISRHFWRPTRRADGMVAALLTAFATFYGIPIVIGWSTGWISTWTVVAATIIAASLPVISIWRHPTPLALRNALAGWRWYDSVPCAAICIILGILLIVGTQLPIRIWDAAGYHAINPMRWAETHRFILDSYGDPSLDAYRVCAEVYPNAKAVLPFLILDITNFERGTAIAQWPFLVLAVCATYAIARRMRLRRSPAFVAALFILAAPEVVMQSLEAYADVAFLAGQMAAIWVIVVIWQDGARWRNLLLASLAFAVLTSAKPTGVLTGGALGIVLLAAILFGEQRGAWRARVRIAGIAVALVVIVSLAIAGPWYVHGLVRFHNPVFPMRVGMFGKTIFAGPFESTMNAEWTERLGEAKGIGLWWKMMNETVPVSLASWYGGLGSHAMILGLPATVLFVAGVLATRERRRYAPLLFGFACMFLTCSALSLPRMVLFELGFGGIALAWVLSSSVRGAAVALSACFVLLAGYNWARCVPSILYRPRPAEYMGATLLTGQTRALMVSSFPDEYTALDFWREELSGPGRVLALPQNFSVWYARPLGRGASVVRVRDYEQTRDVNTWLSDLRKSGATHVYVARNSPSYSAALRAGDQLKLVFWRVDSGAETPMWVAAIDEAGIFEILPAGGKHA